MKFKATRPSIKFDYEFQDGSTATLEYLSPTTRMIDGAVAMDEDTTINKLDYTKDILQECLKGSSDVIEALVKEQIEDGNIYEFKAALDEALGKQKAKK